MEDGIMWGKKVRGEKNNGWWEWMVGMSVRDGAREGRGRMWSRKMEWPRFGIGHGLMNSSFHASSKNK